MDDGLASIGIFRTTSSCVDLVGFLQARDLPTQSSLSFFFVLGSSGSISLLTLPPMLDEFTLLHPLESYSAGAALGISFPWNATEL
jgi:hypothetical protein